MQLQQCLLLMIIYRNPYLKKSEGRFLIFLTTFLLGLIKLPFLSLPSRTFQALQNFPCPPELSMASRTLLAFENFPELSMPSRTSHDLQNFPCPPELSMTSRTFHDFHGRYLHGRQKKNRSEELGGTLGEGGSERQPVLGRAPHFPGRGPGSVSEVLFGTRVGCG